VVEFRSRWLDWSPEKEPSDGVAEGAFVSFGSGSSKNAQKLQLPERVEGTFGSFGSGSSKRSLKAQPPEVKESQTENLGRALPKLPKAPTEPVVQSPFDQFMTEWQITAERVRASFTRNGVQPSYETTQAATWLAFQLNEPWITILGRILKAGAKRFYEAIVQGNCTARFDDYARVVIRNSPRAGARIVL